jgi:H+/gluconate symporter-like permease
MERGLVTLIGMSIAYVASILGMLFAYWAWRRRQRDEQSAKKP